MADDLNRTPHPDEWMNDIGNAERLATFFWGRLAYVPEAGVWRQFDGVRWIDDNDEALRGAQIVARSYFDDIHKTNDPEQQKKALAHAQRSSHAQRLQAMIDLAKTRGLTVRMHEWDRDPFLLGTLSGAVNLRTGELLPRDPMRRVSKATGCAFDPAARAPTWCALLDRIMGGDVAMVAFLQRAIGYSLTGHTGEQSMFVLHGAGANGKSTLLEALRGMLGDYARAAQSETLLARRDDPMIRNDLARLAGARFVTATETGDGRRLAEATIKALSGGDSVTARFLYREAFEFVPTFKLFLATNHKPVIRDDGHAMWRRIKLVPFNVVIPDAEQDRELPAKLAAERAGILNWAIEGALAWQRDGLQTPEPVRAATAAYREENDQLGLWLAERCMVEPEMRMRASAAFTDYRRWADERGERAMTSTMFGRKLGERGLKRDRDKKGNFYGGAGLLVQGMEGFEALSITSSNASACEKS